MSTWPPPARASFAEVVAFHRHACPGLALGYRVACQALDWLATQASTDEELVAVVENNACSVDAVQVVCGCSIGKGNLFLLDHGKHAYTFFCRQSGKGVRIYAHPYFLHTPEDQRFVQLLALPARGPEEEREFAAIRDVRMADILARPAAAFLTFSEPAVSVPERARCFASEPCAVCGEMVMATRLFASARGRACRSCAGLHS